MILKSKEEAIKWFKENTHITNFKPEEFYCNCGCNELLLDTDLVNGIQELRNELNIPIRINSAYRCKTHNIKVGGEPDSQHLYGKAVDVNCTDSSTRYKIITFSNMKKYFKGIGFHGKFIHLDTRDTTPMSFPY